MNRYEYYTRSALIDEQEWLTEELYYPDGDDDSPSYEEGYEDYMDYEDYEEYEDYVDYDDEDLEDLDEDFLDEDFVVDALDGGEGR